MNDLKMDDKYIFSHLITNYEEPNNIRNFKIDFYH
jgi:hypothetical protein